MIAAPEDEMPHPAPRILVEIPGYRLAEVVDEEGDTDTAWYRADTDEFGCEYWSRVVAIGYGNNAIPYDLMQEIHRALIERSASAEVPA